MTATRVIAWKAEQAKVGYAAKSYDARAAFHSGKHTRLKAITRRRAFASQVNTRTENNADFLDQRRDQSLMKIETIQGPLIMKAGTGGLMGDSNEPEIFMQGYYDMLEVGLAKTRNLSNPLMVTNPMDSRLHDASLGPYIDDIFRLIIGVDAALDLSTLCNHDSQSLDESMGAMGHAQNASKAEIVFWTPNRGVTKRLSEDDDIAGRKLNELN